MSREDAPSNECLALLILRSISHVKINTALYRSAKILDRGQGTAQRYYLVEGFRDKGILEPILVI